MLVEFRVKNFLSLRDEQVLSMVASTDKTLQDSHTVATGMKAAPRLLRSAVVYGANASGKSNLVQAMFFMQLLVKASAQKLPDAEFQGLRPFLLDSTSITEPTEFEVSFIIDKVRYQYGFAMTKQRIVHEYLLVYKAAKPQQWFERRFDEEKGDVYTFGTGLKGQKTLWQGATRSNTLFLSTAVQLNSEELKPIFVWLVGQFLVLNEHNRIKPDASIAMLKQDGGRERIRDFLRAADISVSDIEVVSKEVSVPHFHVDIVNGKREVHSEDEKIEQNNLKIYHIGTAGSAAWDFAYESEGTRLLLQLAAPLFHALENGQTLIIDELDTSMHPLVVRELVRLFHRPEVNTGNGQLIFTTHNTSLLDAYGLFRRDQVWLVEKGADQASTLGNLSDFSPRKNEALERGYLQGRYGGIPMLGDMGL